MTDRFSFRQSKSLVPLRSRWRDLTSRVRSNQAVRRVGKWIDGLQADLRGLHTIASTKWAGSPVELPNSF